MNQRRRACIFCDSASVSKEHLWSSWLHPYLAEYRTASFDEVRQNYAGPVHVGTDLRKREGWSANKRVRAVCRDCNSGWMNRIEAAARPYLTPLVEGRPVTLSRFAVESVSRWIVLKVMVCEHMYHDEYTTPSADRHLFKSEGVIPPYFRVHLGESAEPLWSGLYERHSANLRRSDESRPATTTPRNIQVVSFGVGRLFINVIASREVAWDDVFVHNDEGLFPAGCPLEDEWLSWPPKRPLTSDEMERIQGALESLLRQDPRIKWQPHEL